MQHGRSQKLELEFGCTEIKKKIARGRRTPYAGTSLQATRRPRRRLDVGASGVSPVPAAAARRLVGTPMIRLATVPHNQIDYVSIRDLFFLLRITDWGMGKSRQVATNGLSLPLLNLV